MSIVKKSTLQQLLSASLDISHGILFPGIRIEKGSNSQLFVESEQCKMLHVHSIHPNSRPDLFQPIEVTDEEESIPDIFVWINHNEPHKKFKLVSKFAIKPTELETAAPKNREIRKQ